MEVRLVARAPLLVSWEWAWRFLRDRLPRGWCRQAACFQIALVPKRSSNLCPEEKKKIFLLVQFLFTFRFCLSD